MSRSPVTPNLNIGGAKGQAKGKNDAATYWECKISLDKNEGKENVEEENVEEQKERGQRGERHVLLEADTLLSSGVVGGGIVSIVHTGC